MLTGGSRRRTRAVALGTGLLLPLTACMADLPVSVIEGSAVTVAWSEPVTDLNGSTLDAATRGNVELAAATHDGFFRPDGGEVVADETFGTVQVIDPDPASFTVAYDLAERDWSDGVPLDAADLLLGWAALSGATGVAFDAVRSDLQHSADVPRLDEFERRIEVRFDRPVRHWQTALPVAVPAHVVGRLAFGVEDPMEAKQRVVDAIVSGDPDALERVAEAWGSGFDLADVDGPVPEEIAVGSGPYLVTEVSGGDGPATVTLEVNRAYRGDTPPAIERIDLVPGDGALSGFPDAVDVVQARPAALDFVAVRDLERRDNAVVDVQDGRVWVLALRSDTGVFRSRAARRAFLRATSASDVRAAGAGSWDDVYGSTQSLLFGPESAGYDISLEDAGFRAAFEAATVDSEVERAQAGVAVGSQVCVLHDVDEPFAVGAVAGLRTSVAEAGWVVREDCGVTDVSEALAGDAWQAVLTTVPLPQWPSDIADVWGGTEASPLTGLRNRKRARQVEVLDQTADLYDARLVQVALEAGLFKQAVALPLAVDPVLTLSRRGLNAVLPEPGADATLLGGAATWEPEA